MLLFLFALVVAVAGVGTYAHYNPGSQDITLGTYRTLGTYHFLGVPDWVPAAVAAGAMLFLFFIYAVYTGVRIRRLRLR